MKKLKGSLVAAGAVAFALLATGCSTSTQPDTVALAYNDGPIASRTFDKCVPASKREAQGFGDVAFHYPANQRTDNFMGGKGSDRDPIPVADKDGFPIRFPGDLAFSMNLDCDTLREFHEKIGNRNNAYLNDDGSSTDGWRTYVVKNIIDSGLQQALSAAASKYTWREMYSDAAVRQKIQDEVNKTVGGAIDNKTEGTKSFFQGYALTLQVPALPDELNAKLKEEQTNVAAANAARAQADAQVAQAQAETKVAEERAKQKRAELAGYPDRELYIQEKMVEKGLNPKQPTYVVPQAG